MKRFFLLIGTSLLVVSCGQNQKAQISGTFSGIDQEMVYLEMVTTKEKKIIDSVATNKRGDYRFRVKLPVASPTFYNLICNNSTIQLLLAPGEKAKVNSMCDLSHNYTVEGSEGSGLLREFNVMYENGVGTLDSLSLLYAETAVSPDQEELRRSILSQYTREYYKIKREHIAFIVANANSMAALYALYQRLPNDESLFSPNDDLVYYRLVSDSLTAKYPTSMHVIALQKEVEARNQTLEMMQRVNKQMETPVNYPEIQLRDIYGKMQSLTALDGKVILIDFWSAADTRSRVLNAELKEFYAEFASQGFEVYQIALGDSKAVWVNAIQDQRLPWISVADENGLNGSVARTYNISSLPSNVLIDEQGNVIGRNYYGATLKTKLVDLTK